MSMAFEYKSLASGYRLEVTEIRPRLLSSSMRDSFSSGVDGDDERTSLCGENGEPEDKFMMKSDGRRKYSPMLLNTVQ